MKTIMKRALALMMTLALAFTMIPITSATAATKPKLSKTSATVIAGESLTLSVKNAAKSATVKWSSSKKSIATVSKKGKVTGVKAGKSTITAKVTSKGKTNSLKCKVTVTGTKTVATASQLNTALKNTKLTKVYLKTSSSGTFTIPAGTHSSTALVVNAPNADVVNNAVFKSIKIKAIKSDTFTENAIGNKISITAAKARVVVSASAKPAQITISTAKSAIAIVANGAVGNIVVDAAATVNLSGTATDSIPVAVSADAKDAAITSSVPVAVTAATDAKVTLEKGAEGSTVTASDEKLDVAVKNDTTEKIAITTPTGTKDVAAGTESSTSTTTTVAVVTPGASTSGQTDNDTDTSTSKTLDGSLTDAFAGDTTLKTIEEGKSEIAPAEGYTLTVLEKSSVAGLLTKDSTSGVLKVSVTADEGTKVEQTAYFKSENLDGTTGYYKVTATIDSMPATGTVPFTLEDVTESEGTQLEDKENEITAKASLGAYNADGTDGAIAAIEEGTDTITAGSGYTLTVFLKTGTEGLLKAKGTTEISVAVTAAPDSELKQVAYFKSEKTAGTTTYYSVSTTDSIMPAAGTAVNCTIAKLDTTTQAELIEELEAKENTTPDSEEDSDANEEVTLVGILNVEAVSDDESIDVATTNTIKPKDGYSLTIYQGISKNILQMADGNITVSVTEKKGDTPVATAYFKAYETEDSDTVTYYSVTTNTTAMPSSEESITYVVKALDATNDQTVVDKLKAIDGVVSGLVDSNVSKTEEDYIITATGAELPEITWTLDNSGSEVIEENIVSTKTTGIKVKNVTETTSDTFTIEVSDSTIGAKLVQTYKVDVTYESDAITNVKVSKEAD